ncbi:MAG: oligosaccharide flippase family protein [Planctomycetota bacterium]|nr:oligosaccharide flippase family protein [Planctomycetota bacterium]
MDYRRHIRLVFFAFFVQGLLYLRQILLLPILGRALGPEQFGLWGKIQVLGQIVAPFAGLGALEGLGRFVPGAEQHRQRLLLATAAAIIFGSGLAVTAGLAASAHFFAPLLAAETAATPFLLAAVGIMVLVGNLGQAAASFHLLRDRPRLYGVLALLQVVALLAAALALALWVKQSIWIPILAWTIAPALTAAVAFALLRFEVAGAVQPSFALTARAAKEMLGYGLPLLPIGTILSLHHGAGRYLLTLLRPELGNEAVGIYTAHYALAGVVAMAFSPFFLFYQPAVTRLWDSGERAAARHLTRQTAKYSLLVAFPLCAGAPVWADTGARLAAGPDFAAFWGVIFFAMLAYLLQMLASFVEVPLQMEKRTSRLLAHYLVSAAVALAASAALIPSLSGRLALVGAAAGVAIGFGCHIGLNMWACRRLAPGWLDMGMCCRAALAAAAGAAIARLIGTATLSRAALALAAAAAVYALLLVRLGVIKRHEAEVVWKAVFPAPR